MFDLFSASKSVLDAELAVMTIQNGHIIQRPTSTGMAPLTADICSPELLSSPKMPSMSEFFLSVYSLNWTNLNDKRIAESCVINSSFVETFEGNLGKSIVDSATTNDTNLSPHCVKLNSEGGGESDADVGTNDKQNEKPVNTSFSDDGTSIKFLN